MKNNGGRVDVNWLVEQLGRFARREILAVYRRESCIAATRILIDVLEHFGYPASPLVVRMDVMNKPYAALLRGLGRPPLSQSEVSTWQEMGGHCVSVGYGKDAEPGKWPGHLVAYIEHENRFLDGSVDQAERPHKEIILPGLLEVMADREFRRGRHPIAIAYEAPQGLTSIIRYEAVPRVKTYEQSPNWQRLREENYVAHRLMILIEREQEKL